jgi:hypothetical protein
VKNETLRTALRTGVIVGAATGGAVIGMGLRRGDALGPFMNVGRALLTTSSGLVPLPWLAFVGGVALHVVLMLVVGGLFALLALRAHGALLGLSAALYAALVAFAANALGSGAMGAFGILPVSRAQSLFLMALLAAALFAGVSEARGARREARRAGA